MEPSEQITQYIANVTDWRGEKLAELRKIINQAAPELTEEFKWSVPVWTHNGMVCAISGFKDFVKINFFKGASLSAPEGLFNSGLDSKDHRSINIGQNDPIPAKAITALIHEAVSMNKH